MTIEEQLAVIKRVLLQDPLHFTDAALAALAEVQERVAELEEQRDRFVAECERLTTEIDVEATKRAADKVRFTQAWYATRWAHMHDWFRSPEMKGTKAAHDWFSIVANGERMGEPPTYAQQLNILRHSAEESEKQLSAERKRGDRLEAALRAEVQCQTCDGTGIMGGRCENCSANGFITKGCGECHGAGEWSAECAECDGAKVSFRSDEARAALAPAAGEPQV